MPDFFWILNPQGGQGARMPRFISPDPSYEVPSTVAGLRHSRYGSHWEPLAPTIWYVIPARDLPISLDPVSGVVTVPSSSETTAASQFISSDSDSEHKKEFAKHWPYEIALGLPPQRSKHMTLHLT